MVHRHPLAWWPVGAIAVVVGIAQVTLASRYGYHRDELYFRAASEHLAASYPDQPPLTPLLTGASIAIFGDSLRGMRVIAALACMATVLVATLIARDVGANRRAQILAAVATGSSAFVLAVGHMVSTATFDVLIWLIVCWLAIALLRGGQWWLWLALGATIGIGMQNKHLIVLLVVALVVGVVSVGPRSILRSWWPLAAGAVALVIAAPALWWQAKNGWPQLEIAGDIAAEDGGENRAKLIPDQITLVSPLLVPIWIAGLVWLWRDRTLRALAVAYPIALVLIAIVGGKSYYPLPLLLVALAAGCQPTLSWIGTRRVRIVAVSTAVVLALATSAVITLPILPERHVNTVAAINPEQAEQVGWRSLTATVADVWDTIGADEQRGAVILASNYGEAGAIEKYGPEYGLPKPYSGHMSYADWRQPPDGADGPVIVVHPDEDGTPRFLRYLSDCQQVATVNNRHDIDNEENGAIVMKCAGPDGDWSEVWPKLRHRY